MIELSEFVFERLREDEEFVLYRARGPGNPPQILILAPVSEHPSPGSLKRLEHEFSLRAELGPDWAARPLALTHHGGRMMLVLEDPGGEAMNRFLGPPMELTRFLRFAVGVVTALGKLHQRGLIHKDIKPANILVNSATGAAWFTGFGIASRLPRERQSPEPPDVIAGTLAYMAPEQTGRMNRSIDSQSDLYSLGVTLYEMLTGTLPFKAYDPVEWVHCHIARQPLAPAERMDRIPEAISEIVMKLLAKTAEARYQTAAGLEADLRRSLVEWQIRGQIEPFPLGKHDVPDRLLIPEKLYGRATECQALLAAFDRVVTSGIPELVLVSGYSGIGKSSVVNELHKVIVLPRGIFISGKFDQHKRDIPYATLAQAFQGLLHQILSKREEEADYWRDAILEAVGSGGQLVINLIPEVELLIGKQPPVPELPQQEAQKRFDAVLRRFLSVFARKEHPLTLFLDDLQWLDPATLKLLEQFVTDPEIRHLLLIGAYRDNEVTPTHPLNRVLDSVRKTQAIVHEIVLKPLSLQDVQQMVGDALHCDLARAEPLALLVQEKTAGNPFFAIQFLTALWEEGFLAFDRYRAEWTWNVEHLHARRFTDNVVDLMVEKLKRLPAASQGVLQRFACVGNRAEVAILAAVDGVSEDETHAHLWEAVRSGLVLRQQDTYEFLHDRIQEAAYSLIPAEQRAAAHLRIGRRLVATLSDEAINARIFEVVNQLNLGGSLISDFAERERVAELNLRAGRQAKASTAYTSACWYLSEGMSQLGPAGWTKSYGLCFSLALEHAECVLLSSRFDEAGRLLSALLDKVATKVDKAAVYRLRIEMHVVRSENPEAVLSALESLRMFGIDMPAHPGHEEVQNEYAKVWLQLGDRTLESLIDMPSMDDPEMQAAMRILAALIPPSFYTDANLFDLQVCKMVNLSLTYGTSHASTQGYGWFGWILGPVFHRYSDGYRFGKIAVELVERRGFLADAAKVYYAMGLITSWTESLTTSIDFLRTAFNKGIETGDIFFACSSAAQIIMRLILQGVALDEVWQESERFVDFARKIGFRDGADLIVSEQHFIAAIRGQYERVSVLGEAQLDEGAFEAQLTEDRMSTMVCWYWILKIGARFLLGEYQEALAAAANAQALLWATPAELQLLDYHYYSALTLAAVHEMAEPGRQPEGLTPIKLHLEQLREWSESCPETFLDKYNLVLAELARIEGRDQEAMRLYEDAIRAARGHGFVQNEGIGNELAARFYLERGYETIGHAYLREARYCFLRWGAQGKVNQLDERYPGVAEQSSVRSATLISAPVDQLDLWTAIKASHAVSGEIVLERLVETLLVIAVEHAGAERGLLILPRGEKDMITAEARTTRDQVEVLLRQTLVTPVELPESLLRYVVRTRKSVLLDDTSVQNLFSQDEYFGEKHPRSVLCLPLLKQTRLVGVLYLENNVAPRMFTPKRLALLELVASQAAISLDHAQLYSDLARLNVELTQAISHRKKAEEQLRLVVDTTPTQIHSALPDGFLDFFNRRWLEYMGLSLQDVQGWRWTDVIHPEDVAGIVDKWRVALATGDPFEAEARVRRADGEYRWFLHRKVPLRDDLGKIVKWYGSSIDIEERKRAEEGLRRSEAFLAEGQRLSHTGSWGWKASAGELIWSQEHFRILGLEYNKTKASLEAFWERVHPEDRAGIKQAFERAIREKKDFEEEFRIVRPDGSTRHLHGVAHAVLNEFNKLVEFIGTTVDITERKESEQALHQALAELSRVARVTAMGELAASIAHEVNQPLAAVVTSGNACLNWLTNKPPNLRKAREAVERIIRDGNRAGDVLNHIRSLIKRAPPTKSRVNANEAILEVLALAGGELRRHRVEALTELNSDLPPVMADLVQLQQVLLNLVVNAIEAMTSVTDRKRVLRIKSGLHELAGRAGILVAVCDCGVGLNAQDMTCLFEAFHTTKPEGMGMGLWISRSIVEAHGGQLTARPNEGPGATFQFILPAEDCGTL